MNCGAAAEATTVQKTRSAKSAEFKSLYKSGVNVEVALLSELEFKHQVTTARGEEGRRERGHESTEVPGCPEDRKRDGGRGGRGVVASRGWEGR